MFDKKVICIVILILQVFVCKAQSRSDSADARMVADYLHEVRSLPLVKKWNGKSQYLKTTRLLESGVVLEPQLFRILNPKSSVDSSKSLEHCQKFKFLLQTLALYRADILSSGYKRPTNKADIDYIDRTSTYLINVVGNPLHQRLVPDQRMMH